LRQALRSLRKHDAEIFALRYFEEFSCDEIARQTGVSLNAVGVILYRARKRLREILEPMLALDAKQDGNPKDRAEEGKESRHVAT